MTKTKKAFLKALSSVTGNLSAAWFALVFITPNLSYIFTIKTIVVLTYDVVFGIVFLVLTTIIERYLSDND